MTLEHHVLRRQSRHRGLVASRRALLLSLPPAALVAACGTPATGGGTSPSASVVTLRLHGANSGAEADYWPKVVAGFNARQPKIQAVFEPWLPDRGPLVLGASGTLGDVMRLVAFAEYSQVAVKGFLKDLGPLIAGGKFDLKPFYAAAVETLKLRGTQYGLPHIAHPGFCGQFLNLDALKQAGFKEPDDTTWTLADLQATLKQLSVNGRSGAGPWGIFPAVTAQHVTVAARAFGGDSISADGKKSLVAEPASLQGIQLLADLIQKDRAAPKPGTLDGTDVQNFTAGNVSAIWTNFGVINTLNKQAQGLQWKVFMHPKGPQSRGFFMGVDSASMGANSQHPDAAFELVKYVVSKEVSLGWFDVGFAPGARADTWNDPKVTADAAFKVFARAMEEAKPLHLPANGLIVDYNGAITKELGAAWSGTTSAKDAAEAARRAGQEVLDRAV